MEFGKVLTKKTAIVVSTVTIIAIILVATYMPAFAATSEDSEDSHHRGFWAQEAQIALIRARRAISNATDVVVEQAAQGENVTVAKNTLKASIRIYGFGERVFGKERYRASFFTAMLSALVARDSARIALENSETVELIVGEVSQEIDEMEVLLDELEESGVDVSLPRRILERANATYTKARELLENEKLVRGVVAAEISRIIAHVAKEVALISKVFPSLSQ